MKKTELNVSTTLVKGRLTELDCERYFMERGFIVSTPEVPCQYDFLLDNGNGIYKVQVKTARVIDNGRAIAFNTSSVTHNSNGYVKRTYSDGSIDFFCTYHEGICYLVPKSECGSRGKTLRFQQTRQRVGVHFAKDYIAENVIRSIEEYSSYKPKG